MKEKERRMHWHWQNLNEGTDGKPIGLPWHGRAWIHVGNEHACFSWNFLSKFCHAYVQAGRTYDDDTWSASVAFPPVAFWLSISLHRKRVLARFADWICRRVADVTSYGGAELSIKVFDWAIWWHFFADSSGWTKARSRWKDGNFRPLGSYMRKGEPELLEERAIEVPMPERTYKGTAKLERTRWGFTRLPAIFDKVQNQVSIEMDPREQIPFPGKGESSYDCGEDAAFGIYCPGDTIEDGIGRLVVSVMRDRRKRGWDPNAREVAA